MTPRRKFRDGSSKFSAGADFVEANGTWAGKATWVRLHHEGNYFSSSHVFHDFPGRLG